MDDVCLSTLPPGSSQILEQYMARSDSNGDYLPYIKSLDMGDESRYGTVVILSQGSRVAGWNILLFVFVCLCIYLFRLVFNIMCSSRTCIVFLPIFLTFHLFSPTI